MTHLNSQLNFSKGFTRENDIFGRRDFYQNIMKVIKNSPEKNLVFALDDRWGQGKTSFVKMMQGEIHNNPDSEFNVIYFDAYENDYYSDPFIPIAAEFHSLFSEPGSKLNVYKDSFLAVSKRVGAATLIGTLKAVITTSTVGLVDGGKLVDTAVEAAKNSSEHLTDSLEAYVEKKITAAKEEKADIESFKKTLSKIHKDSNKKTIFIIDELDRAKPDFSLDLLEKIKHLFSVDGVIFILVMNRSQFEKCIEKRYGGIDSKTYLNKFINYFLSLPKVSSSSITVRSGHIKPTIYLYIKTMPEAAKLFNFNSVLHRGLSYILEINGCSLREAERCISLLSIFSDGNSKINYEKEYTGALIIMTFLKVYDSTLYEDFIAKRTNPEDLVKQLKLDTDSKIILYAKDIHELLRNMIRYHYLTDDYKESNKAAMAGLYPDLCGISPQDINPYNFFKEGFDNFSID